MGVGLLGRPIGSYRWPSQPRHFLCRTEKEVRDRVRELSLGEPPVSRAKRNADVGQAKRLDFRIGINFGDIVEQGYAKQFDLGLQRSHPALKAELRRA